MFSTITYTCYLPKHNSVDGAVVVGVSLQFNYQNP